MIWKAFLIAIKNKGAQKDLENKKFQRSIYGTYKQYVGRNNKNLLRNYNMISGSGGVMRVGTPYKVRSAEEVGNRFKEKIAPEVHQYVRDFSTLVKENPKREDMSEADFYRCCLKLLKEKYGDEIDVELCHNYMVARHTCEKSLNSSLGSTDSSVLEKEANATAYNESVCVNCVAHDLNKSPKTDGVGCIVYDPSQGLQKMMEGITTCHPSDNRSIDELSTGSYNDGFDEEFIGDISLPKTRSLSKERSLKKKGSIRGGKRQQQEKIVAFDFSNAESTTKKADKSDKPPPFSSVDVKSMNSSVSDLMIPKDIEKKAWCCNRQNTNGKKGLQEKCYLCLTLSTILLLCCVGVILIGVLYLRDT